MQQASSEGVSICGHLHAAVWVAALCAVQFALWTPSCMRENTCRPV